MSETPEMVERVARAMVAAIESDSPPIDAVRVARAIIEAMREPTKAMCDVAHEKFDWGPGYDNAPLGAARPETVFAAMIDTALKTPETQTKTGL